MAPEPGTFSGPIQLYQAGADTFAVANGTIFRLASGAIVRVGALPDGALIRSNLEVAEDGRLLMATSSGPSISVLVSDDRARTWSKASSVTVDASESVASLSLAAQGTGIVILAGEQSRSAFSFAQVAGLSRRWSHLGHD